MPPLCGLQHSERGRAAGLSRSPIVPKGREELSSVNGSEESKSDAGYTAHRPYRLIRSAKLSGFSASALASRKGRRPDNYRRAIAQKLEFNPPACRAAVGKKPDSARAATHKL